MPMPKAIVATTWTTISAAYLIIGLTHRLDFGRHELILNHLLFLDFHACMEVSSRKSLLGEMFRQLFGLLSHMSASG